MQREPSPRAREPERIGVFVCDDQPIARAGIRAILEESGGFRVVREHGSRDGLIEACRESRPDVLLLDLEVGDPCMLETLRELRRAQPRLPVLAYGPQREEDLAETCLRLGATGYLSRAAPNLLFALSQVARGANHPSAHAFDDGAPHRRLSPREMQVLLCFGAGMSVGEAARCLDIRPNSVSILRRRILRKMGLRSNSELILYGLERGLMNCEEPRGTALWSPVPESPEDLDAFRGPALRLDRDLRILRCNAQWFEQARLNGAAASFEKRWGPGVRYFDAVPNVLEDSCRGLFDEAVAWGRGSAATRFVEGSTPTLFRLYAMRVYHLPESDGFVVAHEVVYQRPHDPAIRDPAPPETRAYVGSDGLVEECAHCRRFRRIGSQEWDWVPDWVEQPPGFRRFLVCGICQGLQ